MDNSLELSVAKSESDVLAFWRLFDSYIHELFLNISIGDKSDFNYYYSDEYRDAIEKLRIRQTNPLRILFINKDKETVGFLMYVIYFNENGKCILMEYYIEPGYRNLGYGKSAYCKVEKYIKNEGASYIELTPTNEANEKFWISVGYNKSMDKDGDNKYYYSKFL